MANRDLSHRLARRAGVRSLRVWHSLWYRLEMLPHLMRREIDAIRSGLLQCIEGTQKRRRVAQVSLVRCRGGQPKGP
ncbi:hypothetical protein KOR34_25920 [Posidoniimonas corsicana]|uniref:Uncharacterized protein n=1 Tax=Posidoniimonas corsicana TaxID=1938618 RepID=A0A5C5VGE3_9BACT|nr:hypothetical protein KOR34_25920 [Posidoniimonas corsicana]